MATPAAEVAVDPSLVRALLRSQHPDLADLTVEPLDAGWDNATFLLGADFAVRLPRRALAAPLAEHEQRWLPSLAPHLPLPIPAPVRTGRPGEGYPWAWSVVPWFEGEPADAAEPSPAEGATLGAFLRALHRSAPADAPANPYRGVPLARRTDAFDKRTTRLRSGGVEVTAALEAWGAALDAPPHRDPVWVHGDLHPRNVVVSGGKIAAVIDWGDLTSGDPATDLAAVWMLWPPGGHDGFWSAYGAGDEALRARARGWAAFFAVMLLDTGLADDPRHAAIGRRTLAHLA